MGRGDQFFEVTMAIFLNKSTNKWKVEDWFNRQRVKTKSFPVKALAEKFERETLLNLEKQASSGSQAQDYHYHEIFHFWKVSSLARKGERSLIKDAQMNRNYIEPVIGNLRISEINITHFEKIVSTILKKGLTKATANLVIQQFKAVFNYASNNDLISRNPSKNFKPLKLEKKEMSYLSREELDQLLSYTNYQYLEEYRWLHIFYLTLFLTGIRLGEALGLEWSKISFSSDRITISQMWDGTSHKLIGTTKGRKDRVIPLPIILKQELASLKNMAKGRFIFSENGERPIDPSNFRSRIWVKDLKQAGIRPIRIHDARHTYASIFVMNGGKLYDLKKILGHSDMKTTERYAHLSDDHLASVRNIIQININRPADVINISTNLTQKISRPIHASEENEFKNDGVSI